MAQNAPTNITRMLTSWELAKIHWHTPNLDAPVAPENEVQNYMCTRSTGLSNRNPPNWSNSGHEGRLQHHRKRLSHQSCPSKPIEKLIKGSRFLRPEIRGPELSPMDRIVCHPRQIRDALKE